MDFTKIVRIGRGNNGSVYCKIVYTHGKLSITGVEGPQRNGDCWGSCGQIIMHEWDIQEFAPGWTPELMQQFREVWDQWHLNDMRAGSPNQEAWIKANPQDYQYPKSHYEVYRDALTNAGLNPDPNYLKDGKPYRYGSAWIQEAVPQEVLDFLQALPDTDQQPSWV